MKWNEGKMEILPFYRWTWLLQRTYWSIPPAPPSPVAPLPPFWSSSSSAEMVTGPRSSHTAGSPAPTSRGWRCTARSSPPPELNDTRRKTAKAVATRETWEELFYVFIFFTLAVNIWSKQHGNGSAETK